MLLYKVFMLLHDVKMVVSSAKTIGFECFKQLVYILKRTLSPYFRNLPLLHITIRLHLTSRLLKFMQWLARKQYVLRS